MTVHPASSAGATLLLISVGQAGEGVEGHLRAHAAELGDRVQHAGLTRPDLAEVRAPLGQLRTDGPQTTSLSLNA